MQVKTDRLHWGHLSFPTAAVTATSDGGFVAATQVLFRFYYLWAPASLCLQTGTLLKWGEMKTGFVLQGLFNKTCNPAQTRWYEEQHHLKSHPSKANRLRSTSCLSSVCKAQFAKQHFWPNYILYPSDYWEQTTNHECSKPCIAICLEARKRGWNTL